MKGAHEGLRGKEQAQEAKEETKGLRGKIKKVQIERREKIKCMREKTCEG